MLNLIIPMAGQGKRMRPHTLTTPKPLIPIAGKPIVARLIASIAQLYPEPIENIGFVVQGLTPATQASLQAIAQSINAKAHFYEQEEALGTAHAVACAQQLLQGPTIIAFADTLFQSQSPLYIKQQNIIWVKKVKDPAAFGVVQLDQNQNIIEFIEKPKNWVSDLAIIGLYYFQEGKQLQEAIDQLIAKRYLQHNEYQLTDALRLMQTQGLPFTVQAVDEWLDCGNQTATLHANNRFLEYLQAKEKLVDSSATIHQSVVIPPVYVGPGAILRNSVIGPYVSVGSHTSIENSIIKNSLIQAHSMINQANVSDTMIGNHVHIQGKASTLDLGDYNSLTIQ